MSRAGLNRLTPHATPILLISTNIPDIDILALAGGSVNSSALAPLLDARIRRIPAARPRQCRSRAPLCAQAITLGCRDVRGALGSPVPPAARLDQSVRHPLSVALFAGRLPTRQRHALRPLDLRGIRCLPVRALARAPRRRRDRSQAARVRRAGMGDRGAAVSLPLLCGTRRHSQPHDRYPRRTHLRWLGSDSRRSVSAIQLAVPVERSGRDLKRVSCLFHERPAQRVRSLGGTHVV